MEPIELSSPAQKTNTIQKIKSSHVYKLVLAQQAKLQQHLSSKTLLPTSKVRSKEQAEPTSLLYLNKLRSKEQPPSDSPLYNKLRPKEQLPSDSPIFNNKQPRTRGDLPILRDPKKTNPVVWFGAILCMVFSLLLIFFALSTLIIYLVVKPKTPVFDTPAATMNIGHLNEFTRSDLTFLANFSNPNWKLDVRYDYVNFALFFQDAQIGSQVVQPFSQRPGEARWISVHLTSGVFRFPPNLAQELQKQEQLNRVMYNIKGDFKVRVNLGSIHYTYWLHANCPIEMTSPPTSMLITHSCTTKR